jgi:hypothetical protein
MFEEIIINHKQKLSQTIGINKRFVTLDEILKNSFISESFKTYFNAEVNSWIYEEQIRRETNPMFDFKSDKIKLQLQELDKILYQIARFDRPTLKATIEAAVTTRINFLIRPRTTLKWFVFRGEPTKAYLEIVKRLSFLKGYDYLISGFIEYVNENKLLESERDLFSVLEFANIIEKLDNDYLFSLQPEEFIELLMPLVRFFNPDAHEVDNNSMFPIEALIIFLDDKGIEPLKNKLEGLMLNENIKQINGEMFLKQILDLLTDIEKNPGLYQPAGVDTQTNEEYDENVIDNEGIDDFNSLLPPELQELLDEDNEDISEINEDLELQKGYNEMIELANELSSISKALNELKSREKKDNDTENNTDSEEK